MHSVLGTEPGSCSISVYLPHMIKVPTPLFLSGYWYRQAYRNLKAMKAYTESNPPTRRIQLCKRKVKLIRTDARECAVTLKSTVFSLFFHKIFYNE